MRILEGKHALIGALCLAAAGDMRVVSFNAEGGTARVAREIVSEAHILPAPGDTERSRDGDADPRASVDGGRFRLLTYNVAGLPDPVSPSHPAVNCTQMGPLLNAYDLAFIQEDFSYHEDLSAGARHAFRSAPMPTSLSLMPDGLSVFSVFAIGTTHRMRWLRCNGYSSGASDCLADKGFSFTEVTLAPGVVIDTYNLHADSGEGRADRAARRANFEQLDQFMRTRPTDRAVLVAGDTNLALSRSGDAKILDAFLQSTGLNDMCDTILCRDGGIDRVFFRNSDRTRLTPLSSFRDARFVDGEGDDLSDHPAVGVEMEWSHEAEPASLVARRGPG